MSTPESPVDTYVSACLALQGYTLDAAQTAAVALQFARIQAIADVFLRDPLPPQAEPLPVFRP